MDTSSEEMKPRAPLTEAQKRVLDYIELAFFQKNLVPSYREIMHALEYKSPGAIHRLIKELQKKGYLGNTHTRAWRSLTPVSHQHRASSYKISVDPDIHESVSLPTSSLQSDAVFSLDIIGMLTGSKPPELMLEPKSLVLPKKPFSQAVQDERSLYGLVIQDSSFLGEHLLPGDIIIIEPTVEDLKPGELVLATAQNESIIGHYFDEGDIIRFKSSPYSSSASLHHAKKRLHEETQVWGVILGSVRGFYPIQS